MQKLSLAQGVNKSRLYFGATIWGAAACFALLTYFGPAWPQQELVPQDWLTYRDSTYGFQFRYPADWNIQVTSGFDTPMYARLAAITTSSVPIIVLMDLANDTPSYAVTAWRAREGFQNAEPFKIGHLSGYRVYEKEKDIYGYSHYFFKGPRTPMLELIVPLSIPRHTVDADRLTIAELILSTFKFRQSRLR